MGEKLYAVGKVVNTHGIKGELKIVTQTDFPEVRFAKGSELVLHNQESGTLIPVKVEMAREHKGMYIVRFEGYPDINLVEKYKGWMLKVAESNLLELEPDEYYYHEIIGCAVFTEEGEQLGTISEILSPGANDVWVIERPKGKPLLIPVIDEVLLHVNVKEKKVTIRLMEGLLD